MHATMLLLFTSFLQLLVLSGAASPPASNNLDLSLPTNLTYPPFSPESLNVSAARRYIIPDTRLAIDFWHQNPSIPREDVLMCVIEGLSKIFGNRPSDTIPGLNSFYYKREAFIHVQDLHPTVGRSHTYQDLASTLRGVGEYMTATNSFWTTEFQVWELSPYADLKIGSGGVAGRMRSQADDAVGTDVPVPPGGPATASVGVA